MPAAFIIRDDYDQTSLCVITDTEFESDALVLAVAMADKGEIEPKGDMYAIKVPVFSNRMD